MRTTRAPLAFALAFLLHLSCASSSALADDRRPDKTTLTIATLNAHWLWDGVLPEAGIEPNPPFPWKGNSSLADAHMEAVAQIVKNAKADIICLQEVEDFAALAAFNKHLAGMGYAAYLVPGTDFITGQNMGLLTRVDPEGSFVLRDDDRARLGFIETAVSKNQLALFTVGDVRFALIGLHLVAFPTNPARAAERDVQALVIQNLARRLRFSGYGVVIAGDLNDFDGAADAIDANGDLPISHVLFWLRHPNPLITVDVLTNVASFLPQSQRFTDWFDVNSNGRVDVPPDLFTGIDHILLSPELAGRVTKADILHQHDPATVTDHFPVLASLRTNSGPPTALTPSVRIFALVPDPVGLDDLDEEATIWNTSALPVNLTGWKLRDVGSSSKIWRLDSLGTLQPGEMKTILRNSMGMSLNNNGDTIRLENASGGIVQEVSYGPVETGERLVFP